VFGHRQTDEPPDRAATSPVAAFVERDGADPGVEWSLGIVTVQRAKRGDERFLRNIEGFLRIARRGARKSVHGLTVALD